MKRFLLFTLIVLMFFSVIAGKPKPNPYPPIIAENAYPDPNFPFPGDPPLDKPYVWGAYNLDGNWRWYISKFTSTPVVDATIFLCTAQENPYYQTCYRHRHAPPIYWSSLEYYGYEDGMSIYRSIPISPCGWWGAVPDTSNWSGELFELHQPNWYLIPCVVWDNPIFLPFVRK